MNKYPNRKPSIVWLEGVLDYFNASFPHDREDPRHIGFGIGTQVVGLYLLEMLFQYALDSVGKTYNRNHNLLSLFSDLPDAHRYAVEQKYAQLLSDGVSEAWDFQRSANSFLEYLGEDPLSDSRYFWERNHGPGMSIVFFGGGLRQLIYASFIALHDYPEGSPLQNRHKTRFLSFADSLANKSDPSRSPNLERDGKRIRASIWWLAGLLTYFKVRFPHQIQDPRRLGFELGQRVVGLYLIEMLLKYAADDLGRRFGSTHNLLSLFNKLSRPRRRAVERKHERIQSNRVPLTWDYAKTAVSHLRYLGEDPITDLRYFWERGAHAIPISPGPLVPLVYALLIELHAYPEAGLIDKWYDTIFLPFEESLRASVRPPVG